MRWSFDRVTDRRVNLSCGASRGSLPCFGPSESLHSVTRAAGRPAATLPRPLSTGRTVPTRSRPRPLDGGDNPMATAMAILDSLRTQLDLTDFRKLHWEGSFADYLN